MFDEFLEAFSLGNAAILGNVCMLPLYPGLFVLLANQGREARASRVLRWMGLLVLAGVVSAMMAIGLLLYLVQRSTADVLDWLLPVMYGAVLILGLAMVFGRNPFVSLSTAKMPILRRPAATSRPVYCSSRSPGSGTGTISGRCMRRWPTNVRASRRRWTRLGPDERCSPMIVDSFRFLPRSFRSGYELPPTTDPPVWSRFEPRLADATITLLSSAGLYIDATQASFDLDRERAEATWGDPTHRVIPHDHPPLAMAHLHVNNTDVLADNEVALPVRALDTLVRDGVVGASSADHFSVMGFQGDLTHWRTETGPAIVERCRAQGTSGVVLAPV
jgi:hypothetical protein